MRNAECCSRTPPQSKLPPRSTPSLWTTGTLTKGEPEVTDLVVSDHIVDGIDENLFLALTAAVERETEHPLARAIIVTAEARDLPKFKAEQFESVPGHGAVATVEGRRIVVGNSRLMEREQVDIDSLLRQKTELSDGGKTAVTVAIDGHAVGLIAMADARAPPRPRRSKRSRELGIDVVMLTRPRLAVSDRCSASQP